MKDSKKSENHSNSASASKKKSVSSKITSKAVKKKAITKEKTAPNKRPKKLTKEQATKKIEQSKPKQQIVPVDSLPDTKFLVQISDIIGQYTRCKRFCINEKTLLLDSLKKQDPDKYASVELRLSKEFIHSIRFVAQHLMQQLFSKYAIINRLINKQTLSYTTTHSFRAWTSDIPFNPKFDHPALPAYLYTVVEDCATAHGRNKDNSLSHEAMNAFMASMSLIGITDINKALEIAQL